MLAGEYAKGIVKNGGVGISQTILWRIAEAPDRREGLRISNAGFADHGTIATAHRNRSGGPVLCAGNAAAIGQMQDTIARETEMMRAGQVRQALSLQAEKSERSASICAACRP